MAPRFRKKSSTFSVSATSTGVFPCLLGWFCVTGVEGEQRGGSKADWCWCRKRAVTYDVCTAFDEERHDVQVPVDGCVVQRRTVIHAECIDLERESGREKQCGR